MADAPVRWAEPCPYRVVLEGVECPCPRTGSHLVHRYRSPSGRTYEIELVSIEDVAHG